MRVLVAFATKRGGNEALARAVASGLLAAGHSVDVIAATKVDALDRWDAVVVGGAPYAWFWHRHTQRFIKHDVEELFQGQPPLIIQLTEAVPPPLEVPSIPQEGPVVPVPEPPRDLTWLVHRAVLWLCLFSGVTAVAGGVWLLLARAPFEGYLLPGLILFLVVGLGNLAAAALEAGGIARSEWAVSIAGSALTGWILVQLVMGRSMSWLQLIYFAVGVSTVLSALWLWRARHRLAADHLVGAG